MIYLEDTLCLEFDELVPGIMSKATYDQNKYRGNLLVHGLGGNGRKVCIEYETLPDRYKTKVLDTFGDPYEYAAKQPIVDAIEPNPEAEAFFRDYIFPSGDKLPSSDLNLKGKPQINYIKRYTQCTEWLDMLVRMTTDKITLKRELNISMASFWESSTSLIKAKKISLPCNARKLKDKITKYKIGGWESLIEKHKFGNSHSEKVADEESKALLLKWLCHGNNFDDT